MQIGANEAGGVLIEIDHTFEDGYYVEFDRVTTNGAVLFIDMSSVLIDDTTRENLTEKEIEQRNDYITTINELANYYNQQGIIHPQVTTTEDILRQRIVAPTLETLGGVYVSSRSTKAESRSNRLYPEKIEYWVDFHERVEQYKPTPTTINSTDNFFYRSLLNAKSAECSNEISEQNRLIQNLRCLQPVLVTKILDGKGTLAGHIDMSFTDHKRGTTIICESKSTHNLLLPMKGKVIAKKYNNAYKTMMNRKKGRPTEWSNIGHPIAQLIGYMATNKLRYGALTSGTRTYFLYVEGNEMESQVYISDAWFVGQKNYLRAWAYTHSLKGSKEERWDCPSNDEWFHTTNTAGNHSPDVAESKRNLQASPSHSRNNDSNRIDAMTDTNRNEMRTRKSSIDPACTITNGSNGNNDSPISTITSNDEDLDTPIYTKTIVHLGNCKNYDLFNDVGPDFLPYVSIHDIEKIGVLGNGRNGCCFKVQYNGGTYAMKQYDVGHSEAICKYFVNEMIAYKMLQKAWGSLVPNPIFISESVSGGIMYFGMQLCRPLNDNVTHDVVSNYKKIFEQIKTEYGIQHNDIAARNVLYLMEREDDVGDDKERMVVIDFEDYDVVPSFVESRNITADTSSAM